MQACRGTNEDNGAKLDQADAVPWSSTIPTTSDFFFGWCTFPGFESFRRTNSGSYYIQTLCQILDSYGTKYDLISNLTLVSSVVAEEFEMGDGKKQMPCMDSTLTKLVFFPPKPEQPMISGLLKRRSSPISLNLQPQSQPQIQPQLQPQSQPQPQLQPQSQLQFQPQPQPQLQPLLQPQFQPQLQPQSQLQPQLQPQTQHTASGIICRSSPTSSTFQNFQPLEPQVIASEVSNMGVQQPLHLQLISPPSSNLQNLRPPTSLPSSLEAVLQSSVQTQNTSLESLNSAASG